MELGQRSRKDESVNDRTHRLDVEIEALIRIMLGNSNFVRDQPNSGASGFHRSEFLRR